MANTDYAGRSIAVLVVDDSEFFATMTAETLTEEHGIDATGLSDPTEAIEHLESSPVDCVVSDYEMPEMDGIELLGEVRERWADLPFILLTGRGDEEVASQAIAAGVADYLLKLEVVEDEQYGRLANRIENVVAQHRTEKKYELLVDNSPDVIAQVTEAGRIVTANPAFAAFTGIERSELVGQTLTDVLGDVGEERTATGREVVETGEPAESEDEIGGTYFHNHFVPVDIQGEPDSFQLLSRDVTDQARRQRELERQNERLEEFATVVSHDMRNPLHVAQSTVDLLDEAAREGDEVDRTLVDRVGRSLDRMEALIDDVLTLARQGQTVDDPDEAELRTLARQSWDVVETAQADLTIESSGRIRADSSRLQDVLSNLFVNAVQHNERDVVVRVGLVGDGGGDGPEGFYVADDGAGADPDDEAIFDLGYTTEPSGTGMGLTIVERIAEAHDWNVDVSRGDDGGLRFEFTGVRFAE